MFLQSSPCPRHTEGKSLTRALEEPGVLTEKQVDGAGAVGGLSGAREGLEAGPSARGGGAHAAVSYFPGLCA